MIQKCKAMKTYKTLLDVLAPYEPYINAKGDLRCNCPFREKHEEGHGIDSMSINLELSAYNCFSCHNSGSLMELLTVRFKYPLKETVEILKNDIKTPKDIPLAILTLIIK